MEFKKKKKILSKINKIYILKNREIQHVSNENTIIINSKNKIKKNKIYSTENIFLIYYLKTKNKLLIIKQNNLLLLINHEKNKIKYFYLPFKYSLVNIINKKLNLKKNKLKFKKHYTNSKNRKTILKNKIYIKNKYINKNLNIKCKINKKIKIKKHLFLERKKEKYIKKTNHNFKNKYVQKYSLNKIKTKNGNKIFMKKCWGCHHQNKQAFGTSFNWIKKNRTNNQIYNQIINPEISSLLLGYKNNNMPKLKIKYEEIEIIINLIKNT